MKRNVPQIQFYVQKSSDVIEQNDLYFEQGFTAPN